MFEDKVLTCKICHQEFAFTAPEQVFFAEKEFVEPNRCPECRAIKKARTQQREMFLATCSKCGNPTALPFQPTSDKPVFCRNCFRPYWMSKFSGLKITVQGATGNGNV